MSLKILRQRGRIVSERCPVTEYQRRIKRFKPFKEANQICLGDMGKVGAHIPLAEVRGNRYVRESLIGFMIFLAVSLAAALALLALLARDTGEPVILAILSLLAAVGVFTIFAIGVGLVRFSGTATDYFRSGYEHIADGITIAGSDDRVIYANPAISKLLKVRQIESTADIETALSKITGDSSAICRLTKANRRGLDWDEDVRLDDPQVEESDFAPKWLRVTLRHIGSRTLEVPDQLREWRFTEASSKRLSPRIVPGQNEFAIAALNQVPVGGLLLDTLGRVLHMNDAIVSWTGVDPNPAGGLTLKDFVTPLCVTEILVAACGLVEGKTGPSGTVPIDVEVTAGDGKVASATVTLKVIPELEGVLVAIIIERGDHNEPAMTDNEQDHHFSRFFHRAPIAIATLDERGEVVRANSAFNRMFGLKLRDGISHNLMAAIHEDSREFALKALTAASEGKANLAPVEIAIGKDAKQTGQLYASPIALSNPQRNGAIVYAIDSTKQRELETRFAQGQKMQAVGQLAGGMAHDFNNVLTTIILSSDFLLGNHRPTDPAFKDIMAIKQNASRAAGIVRQLLAFSRQQTLRPRILSLNEVITDWCIWLSRILGEKIELKVSHGRDLWQLKADQTQLEQVIMNLAVNARDAMPEGGRLTIRTSNLTERQSLELDELGVPSAEYVVCEVSDTGCGMPPEVVDKIFEPFFSTKEVGKGTGLGLSMVYGIVKQTGGYITCDSQPGKGTIFRIYLPRFVMVPGQENLAAPSEKKDRPRDMTGSGTVLLVEDEEAVRRFASRALSRQGYEVLEAGTGAEALEVMAEAGGIVDLVVSDIVMPEMDGPTLLKALRRSNPELKIIFISGYAEDALKSLDGGEEFSFLPKPFQLKELVATVKETIEK